MTETSSAITFDPSKDIPSLAGKTILITGANTGLGYASVLALAAHNPSEIYLCSRSLSNGTSAAAEILKEIPGVNIKVVELDLASFESVKKAAARVIDEAGRLDILILNGGIMGVPPGITEEGYEIQFGVNYMGHALLTKLLLPLLEKTASGTGADVRIVALTSHTHHYAPRGGMLFDTLKSKAEKLPGFARYGQSKLGNVLWVREMARLYPLFVIAAVHPGVVSTGLLAKATDLGLPAGMSGAVNRSSVSVKEGVKNQLWAATAKDVGSGEYYEPVGLAGNESEPGKNDELARKLWEWTESELGAYLAESGSGLKL